MGWTNPTTRTVGEIITAAKWNTDLTDNLNAIRTLAIRKTADETLATSTTFQDDNHLFFSVAANEIWAFELELLFSTPVAADFKMQWTSPAGATGNWWGFWNDNGGPTVNYITRRSLAGTFALDTANGDGNLAIRGAVVNSTTAGTLQLQWAQNAASGTTTVFANSFLLGQRL